MAKKYCKSTSVQAIADEVKTLKGSSGVIQGGNLASDIASLVVPTQHGAPSTKLTAASPTKTIERGLYTSGTISVTPQNKTATLTANGSTVKAGSNQALYGVTVPAKNTATFDYGSIKPSSGATSINITGLKFQPIGFAMFPTETGSWNENTPRFILGMFTASGLRLGVTGSNKSGTLYYGVIKNASVSFGTNSITVSNITSSLNGSTVAATFQAKIFTWVAWG